MVEYVPTNDADDVIRTQADESALDDAENGGQRPRDAKVLAHMKPKHVFILGRGAALGAYQIGARRLLEEHGVRPVRAAAPRKHA